MRVLRKNPEPRPGMPGARILPLKGVGKRNAAAALGLVLQPPCPCTRQLLAQAGCQALGYTQGPNLGPLALTHDARAAIEIQIHYPPLHPGSAPPASAATAEVFRSPEARADPCTAPCRRRTARPPMPDDAWRPKPCARSPARTEMPRLRCCPRLPGDAHRGNG